MMLYQIHMDIGSEGLLYIYKSKQVVTIVKKVDCGAETEHTPAIAWFAFQPFRVNSILWSTAYYMYATTTPLREGALIQIASHTEMQLRPGWTYPFVDGLFGSIPGQGDTYNTVNKFPDWKQDLAFGLTQQVSVNNVQTSGPLNAVPVPLNKTAAFAPTETVSIFLSEAENTRSGTVIGKIPAGALTTTLSGAQPDIHVSFDDRTHTFVLAGRMTQTPAEFAKRLVLASGEPRDLSIASGATEEQTVMR
ncbi:hypothetical protein [Pendulispora albinea]|uniref:Uncharacterized protein n=1 Tax=Pendulispora albinea TaxID=2741071 RepID=A0ABZ2LUQ9_9BACT